MIRGSGEKDFSDVRLDLGRREGRPVTFYDCPTPESSLSVRVPRLILLLQSLGFGLVLATLWADELLDLPHVLFGAAPTPGRLSEAVFESAVVALLGVITTSVTARLTRRIVALESFVVLCGWCRRIRNEGEWLTFESFFAAHQANTSHGLCPECAAKLEAE
jgi:hypothetical protein